MLDNVERRLTGWDEPYTMRSWFAPTGLLVLLPYTLFPFPGATYYWLISNVAIIFTSVLLIWRNKDSPVWIPLTAAFGFSMTLLSLIYGQVNTLEVLGLALFLFFNSLKRDYAAGAGLVLTTVKPHLVILTLPLLFLDIIRRKQWRVLIGFVGTLTGCALILFVLYPSWPISFWRVVLSGMNTVRVTPTVPGLLVLAGEHIWSKWIWVIVLLFAIVVWWKHGKKWDQRFLIDVSLIAGMIAAPIGWSYDQVMLLFPILRVLEWASNGSLKRVDTIAVTLALIAANAISFYQRIFALSEVWFFWIPIFVVAVYMLMWQRRQVKYQHLLLSE